MRRRAGGRCACRGAYRGELYFRDAFIIIYRRKCMKYLHLKLEEIMQERRLSKKKVCSALDIERTNFKRYYRDEFQRIDANLLLKLCAYFECEMVICLR